MGTDVIVKGNHKIEFDNRRICDVIVEIDRKLNSIEFSNDELSLLKVPKSMLSKRENWFKCAPAELDFDAKSGSYLVINGLVDLYLDKYQCEFIVAIRHSRWSCAINEGRDEWQKIWRRVFYKIVHAIGGDRVVYLADNSHFLNKYDDFAPFEEIEKQLQIDLGASSNSIYEAYASNNSSVETGYFIDFFTDLSVLA